MLKARVGAWRTFALFVVLQAGTSLAHSCSVSLSGLKFNSTECYSHGGMQLCGWHSNDFRKKICADKRYALEMKIVNELPMAASEQLYVSDGTNTYADGKWVQIGPRGSVKVRYNVSELHPSLDLNTVKQVGVKNLYYGSTLKISGVRFVPVEGQ